MHPGQSAAGAAFALATLRRPQHSAAASTKGGGLPTSKHAHDRLWKQVERIESDLASLRTMLARAGGSGQVSPDAIAAILDARRRRETLFGPGLFADPAWDILLELYAAQLKQDRLTVGEVCSAAAVPPTTALGWIKQLERAGLLVRIPDTNDRRRIFAELSDRGAGLMARFFCDSGEPQTGL